MMNRDEFDVSGISDAPGRIIGTLFDTPANYFRLKPMDEDSFVSRYSLGAFDAEVRSLHRLIVKTGKKPDRSTDFKRIDDRRSTIEVQFEGDRLLRKKDLIAVILPEPYFLEARVTDYFGKLGARLLSYQVHPLNPNHYYAIIYEKIHDLFQKKRYI
jgi:hypothetical protein